MIFSVRTSSCLTPLGTACPCPPTHEVTVFTSIPPVTLASIPFNSSGNIAKANTTTAANPTKPPKLFRSSNSRMVPGSSRSSSSRLRFFLSSSSPSSSFANAALPSVSGAFIRSSNLSPELLNPPLRSKYSGIPKTATRRARMKVGGIAERV